jgi:hypothetical protein
MPANSPEEICRLFKEFMGKGDAVAGADRSVESSTPAEHLGWGGRLYAIACSARLVRSCLRPAELRTQTT